MLTKILLRVFALIYLVRFAAPALLDAGAGAPFGAAWLSDAAASTLLLDSDLRYFGVTCATVAALFFVGSFDVKRHMVTLDVIMLGVLAGAAIRTWEIAFIGVPPGPAVVATAFEWLFPIGYLWSVRGARAERETRIQESIEVDAPAATVWGVFADFGGLDAWHPYMERAGLDDGSPESGVGAARTCDFGPNMSIRETVLEWDDAGSMTIGIDFLRGPPMPLRDIRASVDVKDLGDDRAELILTMRFLPRFGAPGTIAGDLFAIPQYRAVFGNMLAAARRWAERGETVPPVAMLGSGRKIA